jgi:hypothetical protein
VATSGSISTTVFNTGKVIDNGYRYCRLPAAAISGEMIEIARQQLYLLLSGDLGNTGVPLWCQTKYLLPMYIGQPVLPCPAGTIDVLNANIRTLTILTGAYTASEGVAANAFDRDLTTACVQTTPAGFIAEQLDTATLITTIGILPGATGAWDITFQYSEDGLAWTDLVNYPAFAAVDGLWQWFDFGGFTPHLFYRLKANGATVLDVIELAFANNPNEIPVARLNKDDYFNLPDKAQHGRPVQYWLDRQASVANMYLWPAPDTSAQFQQIVILVHRHVMDVGTMTETLEIPQRWFEAICWMLAKRLALITPDVKMEVIPIVNQMADDMAAKAWMEERDDSPFYLQPNFSMYTR